MTQDDKVLLQTLFADSEQRLSVLIAESILASEARLKNEVVDLFSTSEKYLRKEIGASEDRLKRQMDGVEKRLSKAIEVNTKRIDRNDQAIEFNRKAIESNRKAIESNRKAIEINRKAIERNADLIKENSYGISRNGVLMEQLQDAMQLMIEGNINNMEQIQRSEKRMDEAAIEKVPILWDAVKKQGRKIQKMEARLAR